MGTFVTIIHVVICLVLIGGDAAPERDREGGGDIGGGGGGGMKPVQSGNKFMERLTSTMAAIFMLTASRCLRRGACRSSVMQGEKSDAPPAAVPGEEGAMQAVELDEAAEEAAPAAGAPAS